MKDFIRDYGAYFAAAGLLVSAAWCLYNGDHAHAMAYATTAAGMLGLHFHVDDDPKEKK